MWDDLSAPWQACLELAWEAYCAGTIPIGAVVTAPDGSILSRGRNRILDDEAPPAQVFGNTLAHAELNALLSLKADQETRHHCILYTTMEPCPLCMGAFYMSAVRTLHFLARDPWAGSVNLLGTTPYLSHKPINAVRYPDERLECMEIAIHTDFELGDHGEEILKTEYGQKYASMHPRAVRLGLSLFQSNELRRMNQAGAAACEVFDRLAYLVEQTD
jgi:tRNA(adenine34) deaminase